MDQLQELRNRIEQVIQNLSVPSSPKDLYEPISYALSNGGKRMRPILVLIGCKIFNESVENALRPAIGMELFHNFSLIHDDIMDDAPIRRGKPTVHERWNSNVAILSGDAMMIQAYQQLVETRPDAVATIIRIFNQTAIEVCEGQQLDMDFEKRDDVSIDEYLNMIRLKTAVLLAACLKIGATIGGANEEQAQFLYDFGLNTGIAFQLQDDILDVYGESQKVGKQKGGDILLNKKTYLLLKALELTSDSGSVEQWLKSSATEGKVAAVTEIYNANQVRELAEKRMWEFYDIGVSSLEKVQGNAEWVKILLQFCNELMHREN